MVLVSPIITTSVFCSCLFPFNVFYEDKHNAPRRHCLQRGDAQSATRLDGASSRGNGEMCVFSAGMIQAQNLRH